MKLSRGICILIVTACLILFVPATQADEFDFAVNFQAVNQNMWSSGQAAVFDKTYFAGATWDKSGGIGGVSCGWLGCYGAEATGHTWGKAGLELDIHADAGSVNASYPADINLSLPLQPDAGQTIQISSVLDLQPGSLTTAFPNAEIVGSMVLQAHATLGGRVCVVGCVGGTSGDLIGLDIKPELFSFNKDDNGQLALLGVNLPFQLGEQTPIYGGPYNGHLGDITLNVPNLDLTGADATRQFTTQTYYKYCLFPGFCFWLPNPPVTTNVDGLAATGQVDVLTVQADILNIGMQAAGLPPLSASFDAGFASASGTLLEVSVGAALGIWQDFFLYDPSRVKVNLHIEETGQDVLFNAGSTAWYTVPSQFMNQQLHITPSFYLEGTKFINNTDLIVSPVIDIDALEACFDVVGIGGCLGPVFDYTWHGPAAHINVYDNAFNLNFARVYGDTITLQVGGQAVPEPATMVLVASGLAALAAGKRLTRRRRG